MSRGKCYHFAVGDVLVGPLYDEEGILSADLDLAEVARGKFDFDVVGHYARPDVFQLVANKREMSPTIIGSSSNDLKM